MSANERWSKNGEPTENLKMPLTEVMPTVPTRHMDLSFQSIIVTQGVGCTPWSVDFVHTVVQSSARAYASCSGRREEKALDRGVTRSRAAGTYRAHFVVTEGRFPTV